MRKLLPVIICAISIFSNYSNVNAQSHQVIPRKCGSEFPLQEIMSDPVKAAVYNNYQKKLQYKISQMQQGLSVDMNRTYYIPVVFHIIDPNPNSITDAMIQHQVDVLNRDYSGYNTDSVNATKFYNVRGHLKLIFVLAKRSPENFIMFGGILS